ncbi:MAG TPA: HD domain-containing protein [Rectinemataceae bacterium]|nr:HD domain-containing protein [Rectinemataceae bacterium]
MDLDELEAKLEAALDRTMMRARARHSRAVAALSAELCERNGLSSAKGRVAGLAHDLCKELDLRNQSSLASIYASISGRSFVSDGVIGEAALHGPAAAGLLAGTFGCADEEILEAIALHTLGSRDMGDLARITYAADKLEPGRKHVDPEFRARCLLLPPAELFGAVLASTVEWLRSVGLPVAEESLALYDPAVSRETET